MIINMLASANEQELLKIMENMELNSEIALLDLHINPMFTFDKKEREKYKVLKTRRKSFSKIEEEDNSTGKPNITLSRLVDEYDYQDAIKCLTEIFDHACPEEKIDCLQHLNSSILSEIEAFWNGYDIPKKDLDLDHENLLSLYIYIVLKFKNANLWVQYLYTQAFLTETARLSSRGYFMANIGVALEHIMKSTIGANEKKKVNMQDIQGNNQEISGNPMSFTNLFVDCRIKEEANILKVRSQSFEEGNQNENQSLM